MRLIDADALKTPIEDRIDNIPASEYDNGWNNAIYAVIDEIDNAPTVETSKVEYKAYNDGFKDGVEQGIKLSEKPQGKRAEGALSIINCLYTEGHINNMEQGILRRAVQNEQF